MPSSSPRKWEESRHYVDMSHDIITDLLFLPPSLREDVLILRCP